MSVGKKCVSLSALLAALASLLLAAPAWAGQAGKSPVKVFILAGQSNMDEQGEISGSQKGILETLVKDPASAPRYKHLVDKDGKWVVRDDVWCSYGNKVTMKLLKLPAGKILMGSRQGEEGRRSDEGPQHEVTISKPFYLGVFEVTVEQFDQFVKDSGYAWEKPVHAFRRRGDHPATDFEW